MSKRVLCLFLTACLVMGMLGGTVLAAGRMPFADVKKADWFYDAVRYVYANGIMNGTGETTFSPQEKTTRGMIVTMLYRFAGEPAVSGPCVFQDVAVGKYYRSAVIWAANNQIVSGMDSTCFAPDEAVTREQLATILYRYAAYQGYDTGKTASLTAFQDRAQIGSYATAAMRWAVGTGLLTGISATELQPRGFALRSQVAAILMRFCEGVSGQSAEEDGETAQEDPDAFVLKVDAMQAAAGDNSVLVPISVRNNPGILGMRLSVSYDESVLTLAGATNGDAVSRVLTLTKAKTLHSGCNFVWDGLEISGDEIQDGDVLVLRFRVSETAAAGTYPVTICYQNGDLVDNDLETLSPQIQNGSVSVE